MRLRKPVYPVSKEAGIFVMGISSGSGLSAVSLGHYHKKCQEVVEVE